jgi:hypothetical protein
MPYLYAESEYDSSDCWGKATKDEEAIEEEKIKKIQEAEQTIWWFLTVYWRTLCGRC